MLKTESEESSLPANERVRLTLADVAATLGISRTSVSNAFNRPEQLSKELRNQILAKSSGNYLEIGLATATLYLLMSVPLGYLSRYLEKRWSKGTAG